MKSELKQKVNILIVVAIVIAGILSWTGFFATAADNGNSSGYAFSERVGFIRFDGTDSGQDYGVTVSDTILTGYAWSENAGWIHMASTSASCIQPGGDCVAGYAYSVANDGAGKLSGYAWGEGVGWIHFAATSSDYSNNSTSTYGVSIDSGGNFQGYAWGEQVGWIHFKNASPYDYGVTTDWSGIPTYTLATTTGQTINVYHNLTIGDGTNEVVVTASTTNCALNIDGNITINATSTFVAPTSSSFTVAGNWSNSGTFTHSDGTTTFDGSSTSTFAGATTFYNFLCSTGNKGLEFTDGTAATTTVSGTLTLTGDDCDNKIKLRSTSSGNYWYLNAMATTSITYVDVQDSNATGSASVINASSSYDSLNNVNWNITEDECAAGGGITVSGNAYEDEATTTWNGCDGSTSNISLVVNGTFIASTTCSNATGTYSFSSVSVSANDPVSVFFNVNGSNTDEGVAITVAVDDSSDIILNPRLNRVWIKSEDGVANITNTNLDHCDSVSPAECSSVPYAVTTGNLTLESAGKLIIESSKTFLPGGIVTLAVGATSGEAGGDVLISSGATFNAEANNIFVGGDWNNNGTFSNSNNTVTFTATSTGFAITASSSVFYDLTFNGSGGGWTFQDNATTTNNFTITNGTITGPSSGTISVANNWTNTSGTFIHNNSTVKFTAIDSGNTITTNGSAFYNVECNGANGVWDLQEAASTTNDLTITAGTLDLNGQNLLVQGGDIAVTGILAADLDSGTVTLSGSGNLGGSGTTTVYNLTLSGTTALASKITVNNDLTISGANSLDVSGSHYDINVGGSWANASGTFTAQQGTVTFNSSGAETIDSSSSPFYDLTFDGSGGGWTFSANATTTNDFTITQGTVTSPSGTLEVGGSWSNSGVFTHNDGTVLFNATTTGKTIDAGNSSFYDLSFNHTLGGWTFFADATTTNDFMIYKGAVISTSGVLAVGGTWYNSGNGTFTHNSGTILFNTSGSENIFDGNSPFHLMQFDGLGQWLYTDGCSTAPATTTVDNGSATFFNAKTGSVVFNDGELNVDWYLGVHVVDANDTTHNIANATATISSTSTADNTIWKYNGNWGSPATSQETVTAASGINPQPTNTGAIRIREYSRGISTTTYYRYNLTIPSLAGFDSYNYYADKGNNYLTSTSSDEGSSVDKTISISWYRATAGAMNDSQPYSGLNEPPEEGSWYIGMPTDLEFSVDSASVNLGTLYGANDYTATGTTILYATTTYSGGYNITAWGSNDGRLRLGATATYIARWNNANSTPALWSSTCNAAAECGFGYTTSDNNLGGTGDADRFATSSKYAGFATSTPGDLVADSTTAVSGATTTVGYRVSVADIQTNGDYSTTIYYICTANY